VLGYDVSGRRSSNRIRLRRISRHGELIGAGLSDETIAKKLVEAQAVAAAEQKLAA